MKARIPGRLTDGPLVYFTLASQAAAGTMIWLALIKNQLALNPQVTSGWVLALSFSALLVSFWHLGSPLRAFQAIRNLRTSWLSREIVLASGFCLCLFVLYLAELLAVLNPGLASEWPSLLYWLCAALGAGLVFAMAKVYRLRTAPGWGSPLTGPGFFVSGLLLGGSALAIASFSPQARLATNSPFGMWLIVCLILQTAITLFDFTYPARTHPSYSPEQAWIGLRSGLFLASVFALVYWNVLAGAGLILLAELFGRVKFYARRRRLGV
jgi:anaerobic dimethyl sulfoxide reductase subunit C